MKYDPGCCLALSGPGPPARKVLPGSQACRKLPSQRGQEVGATSSPGQGRNQISWPPGLLVCSLSLVSLEVLYKACFHPVLEITFDLVFVIRRESEAKFWPRQFLGAAILDWNCCAACRGSLCFSVLVCPNGKTVLESHLISHT